MRKIKLKYLTAIILLTHCSDDKEAKPLVQVSADFIFSHTTIKVGESVAFSDASKGNANEWNWIFEGGEPASSTEQNPVVRYESPGSYNVSLNVSNGTSEDTEAKENLITVEVKETPLSFFEAAEETTFGLSVRSDFMQSMITLEDHSFICVGWTDNVNTQESQTNILVTKFDKDLKLVWNKVIVGSRPDLVRDIIATADGGFLLNATTESKDGDIPENKGSGDVTIFKLNDNGDIHWAKTYGGSDYDGVNKNSLIKLENGYAFIGFTKSQDGDIVSKVGLHDIWLVEIDNNGNIVNSFALGSTESDYPYSFVKSNTGYVILSKIGAKTDDFDRPGIWLFEVNGDGQISWKTFIDGLNAGQLIKTRDNGYITLNTNRTNITDLFVTKFGDQGSVQWEKSFPLPGQEFAEDIIQIGNEYVILGTSEPSGNAPRHGSAYVAKINQMGDIVQSGSFGDGEVSACRIFKMDDQKYILGGTKDVDESYIDAEFWLQIVLDSD